MDFEIFNQELNKYNGHEEIITIPDGITTIKDFACYGIEEVKKIIIPDSVTYIGNYAFHNCANLEEIILPDSITTIGDGVFSGCESLVSITIPSQVKSIGKTAFYKCFKLENIELPDCITSIGHTAFSFCTSLVSMRLPNSLVSLGDSAFEECENLHDITLPDGVKTLGKRAFFHCLNLRKITLSSSLKEVGEGAFQTHGKVTVLSNDTLHLTSKMFDCNWNFNWKFSFKMKNGDGYLLVNSYLPDITLREWKPFARLVVLTNFLETYSRHTGEKKQQYIQWCEENKAELVEFIVMEKRFTALNQALEINLVNSQDIEPYFDLITDREEKAKILEYKNKESKSNILDDLESELMDLF